MHELYDHADSLFNALWSDSNAPWQPSGPAPFITISREAGSGGSSFARALCRKLNSQAGPGVTWRVIEDEITALTLRHHGLSTEIGRYLPEDRTPEFLAMLGELVGLHPNIWGVIQKVHDMQRQLAQQGHVILVGRAAHLATAGLEGGLHVRTIAPRDFRVRMLAEGRNLTEDLAARHIARCDRARRLYARQHYSASLDNPHQYDLVLNMEKLSQHQAVAVVSEDLAHRRASLSTTARWTSRAA